MKELITIEVNLDKMNLIGKENAVLVHSGKSWKLVSKEEWLIDLFKEINALKSEIGSYKLAYDNVIADNEKLKKKINLFEKVLIDYGFNLMRGESQ